MIPLLEGIKIGLMLSILAGPLLFALLQAGLEQGAYGGFSVAFGIWISDALFIAALCLGFSFFYGLSSDPGFRFWITLLGGFTLGSAGIGMLLSRTPSMAAGSASAQKTMSQLLLRGFLLNTINPFTVFFWLGAIGATAVQKQLSPSGLWLLCFGIMMTIVCTDSAKVLFAKSIRRFLSPGHMVWLRRISGCALLGFGLWLLGKGIVFNGTALY